MKQRVLNVEEVIENKAKSSGAFAVAFAILELNRTQRELVKEINALGFKDAATPMGALEHLALEVKRSGESVSAALGSISDALWGLDRLREPIESAEGGEGLGEDGGELESDGVDR